MALLDAYATDTQYRARTGDKSIGTDANLNQELLAASRLLERALGVAAGAFNLSTSTQRTFDAHGGTVLYLRDREGRQHFLNTVGADGIGVDADAGGAFNDYTLDFADAWVRGLPENAALGSEPFTAIELLPITSATLMRWPDRVAATRITATWGWTAVPQPIVALAIHLVHDLRDAHLAGAVLDLPGIDRSLPLQDDTWRLWLDLRRLYSRALPVVG
jgi:hypothetical protein